jgi:hypothetical protein
MFHKFFQPRISYLYLSISNKYRIEWLLLPPIGFWRGYLNGYCSLPLGPALQTLIKSSAAADIIQCINKPFLSIIFYVFSLRRF